MRVAAVLLSLTFGLSAPAQAQPFEDLFDYQEPRRPLGGDCGDIAAAVGPEATWRGEASGRRYEDFTENYYPFGVQGCFASEVDCRIFLNQAATYAGRGPMSVLSCRRGLGSVLIRVVARCRGWFKVPGEEPWRWPDMI